MTKQILLCLLLIWVCAADLVAEDWPQFQGPRRNGTSSETGLARQWPQGGPLVLWTAVLGEGFGGAAIHDGEVFVLDRVVAEKDVLRCFNLDTGEEVWRYEYEVPGRLDYAGSRTVPTVEEDLVFTVGGFGDVHCINRTSHDVVWSRSLANDYQGQMPRFGWSQSPLVHDGVVVLAPLSSDVGLLALDKITGDEVWQTKGLGNGQSTPALIELDGVPQVVFISTLSREMKQSWISSFDLHSGDLLWRTDTYFNHWPIPPVTKIDRNRLFVTGGYEAGSLMLEVKRIDKQYQIKELFRIPKGSQIHLPMLYADHLYLLANENANDARPRRTEGGLMCLDLMGNVKWRTGNDPYFGRGSLLQADGLLIIQDGHSGALRLIEPDPSQFKIISEANLFDTHGQKDHRMWAPMAFSKGRLLLRSQSELKCVDLSVPGTK